MFIIPGLTVRLEFLTNQNTDTLTCWLDGYQTEKKAVNADNYVTVRMKLAAASSSNIHQK